MNRIDPLSSKNRYISDYETSFFMRIVKKTILAVACLFLIGIPILIYQIFQDRKEIKQISRDYDSTDKEYASADNDDEDYSSTITMTKVFDAFQSAIPSNR